ncbi:hypothetical protein JGU71_17290 [Antrihabitans sp. YC3-6]|uniref:Uncharacterized protein n=1 Tax=Antrihabitans stalagmiti TaxID=2799499 RepID=A0A934NSF4_9NOCA|nr:hypothetical protein [Antrihabitans stalagmiti]MBJ8340648.1 hypothetical protein [Antrihabitans stalagmiti]
MSDLVTRAQLTMLAKLLHVPVERVQHLEHLGADQLFALRDRMAGIMFDENAEMFSRIAMLVPIVPLQIAMPIVQKVTSPEMAGRSAGAVAVAHPKKAAAAMTMVDIAYGASAASFLDPRAVAKIAHVAPHGPVVDIANELMRRKDYITGGLFVDAATPELIRAIEAGVDDDEGLIRTGAYVHSGKVVSDILRVIIDASPGRIARLITTVVGGSDDLQIAALSVFARIDADLIEIIGDTLFEQEDPDAVGALVRNFVANDAISELMQFVGHLSESALRTFGGNPVAHEHDLLEAAVTAAADHDDPNVWHGLLNIADAADTDVQRRVLELVVAGDGELPTRIAASATDADLWPLLLRILANQTADLQERVAASWGSSLPEQVQETVLVRARELGLEEQLRPATAAMSAAG